MRLFSDLNLEKSTNTVGTAFMLSTEKAEKQDSINAVRTMVVSSL